MLKDKRNTLGLLCGDNPFLELAGMLITSIVQMEDEHRNVRLLFPEFLEQFDDLGIGDGAAGLAHVDIFLVLRTIGAEDIKAFASAAYTEVETLAPQEPAREDGFQTPDRMTGVDEVALFF